MDHGFRMQNLLLNIQNSPQFSDDVVQLNNGFIFKNELLEKKISENTDYPIDVISIKLGKPFVDTDQIFHILPAIEETCDYGEEFTIEMEQLRGGDMGCIPRYFVIENEDNFEVYSKQIGDNKFLIPLALAMHGPVPDPDFPYSCEAAYIKVDFDNLSAINQMILDRGVDIQGGLNRSYYDMKSKFCTQLTLIDPHSNFNKVISGMQFSDGDIS